MTTSTKRQGLETDSAVFALKLEAKRRTVFMRLIAPQLNIGCPRGQRPKPLEYQVAWSKSQVMRKEPVMGSHYLPYRETGTYAQA